MITTADGYRFTLTPFSPLMTEITGEIIPVTDGTASVEDNIFINAGSAPKHTDWHPEGARITYSGNVTIGFADQPSDIGAQHGEPPCTNQRQDGDNCGRHP